MKRTILTASGISLLLIISTFALAQDSPKNYRLWGIIEGSSCPVCDNYVKEMFMGKMTLEVLPVACPNCAAYSVLGLSIESQFYEIELGKNGGLIHFIYGDPTAHISVNLIVNGFEETLTGDGYYAVLRNGWPVFLFPDLSSGWFSLGFVAFPTRR